jgi:hypothetical protein
VEPRKPEHTDPFAEAFLRRLGSRPEAAEFVLGGYFALKHYLDYRETGDIDAWWLSRLEPAALDAARAAFADTAAEFGYAVRERAWAETVSLEALHGTRRIFSFQVAVRTVALKPPVPSPWGGFPIETLDDNVASKMVALVQRGAPRDFIDIKHIVDAGLLTAERCWELWAAKDPGADIDQARLEVEIHLQTIEARMPLDSLPAERRDAAARLRAWYHDEFAAPRHNVERGERRGAGEESDQ